MATLSNPARLERKRTLEDAERLVRAGGASNRALASVLQQKVKLIDDLGTSSDEERRFYVDALLEEIKGNVDAEKREARYKKAFDRFIYTGDEKELREIDLQAGTQSIFYTAGPLGGYLIPIDHVKMVFEATAQADNLLSEKVCSFTMDPGPTLQLQTLWGYDLSTISASQVGEGVQQTAGNFPPVAGRILRGNIIYKASIAASIEAEDNIPDVLDKFARAYGVAFARKLGADAVLGNGTTQPQGLLTALPTAVYSTGSGKITLTDLNTIYFSVNRIYRAQPKCGWLVSDSVYERLRGATDNSERPLLSVERDTEMLLGKPISICPSLGVCGGSPATNSTLVFGDLSAFHIRVSRPTIQRAINASTADILSGRSLYIARIRMDSALFDPSGGSAAPIVTATITV